MPSVREKALTDQVKMSYVAALTRVRCELTRAACLKSETPPADLIARAKAKLESVKAAGEIAFYFLYETRLHEAWKAMRAEPESEGDRKVVTILKSHQPGWWDVETGRSEPPVWKPVFPENSYSLVASTDGRWTAASGIHSCLLWNVEGESFELNHPNHVQHAAFHPDGQSLLATCWDGTARRG